MMKTKRVLSLFLVLALLCTVALQAVAKPNAYLDWSQFRGNTQSAAITDAKLPTDPLQVEEKWALKLGTGWSASVGTPIIVGDYIYVLGNGNLNRISKETGEVLKSVPCNGSSQFFSQIAYGDGKIFVPRSISKQENGQVINGVVVYAYEEETMEQLWVSELLGNPQDALQPLSAITYYQGYIYLGISNGQATKGAFVCLNTEDEQPELQNEIKQPTWTYQSPEGKGGFYWSAGAIVGNAILFGGENNVLVSHSLTQDQVIDTITLEEGAENGIRSTVAYDAATERAFVSTKTGKIHSVKVDQTGRFQKDTLLSKQLDQDITSSPVVYHGRIYQGGGGIESQAGFSVLDAETLEIIYTIPEIQTQASPILTTAYATEENQNTVYLYVTKYAGYEGGSYASNSSCTYVIQDAQGQTQPSFRELITPSTLQYCTQSLAVAEDGGFCYYNDSAKLFYFDYKNPEEGAYTVTDVENAIDRLPEVEKITLQDEFILQRTQERLHQLSSDQQAKVKNLDRLQQALAQLEQLKEETNLIADLIKSIDLLLLENLQAGDYAEVMALQAKYEALSEEGKAQVTNVETLQQAVILVTNLKNQESANQVNDLIDKLPDSDLITKENIPQIQEAYQRYQSQSEAVKAFICVERKEKLLSCKERADFLDQEIDAINLAIWRLPIDQITLQQEELVQEIVDRYHQLGTLNQRYIKGYDDVIFAQQVIAGLKEQRIIAGVFEQIQGKDKDYLYANTVDGYEFLFNGLSIQNPVDFSTIISFQTAHQAQIQAVEKQAQCFSLAQQGNFPGTVQVTFTVALPDGDYHLYQYQEQTGTVKQIQPVSVKDGKASVSLACGGEYFIAQKWTPSNMGGNTQGEGSSVETGDTADVIVPTLLLAAGCLAVILGKRRK